MEASLIDPVANACTAVIDSLLDGWCSILGRDRIDASHLAVRGERLALTAMTMDDASVLYVVAAADRDGRVCYAGATDDIGRAFEDLDRRYLTTVGPMRSAHLTHAMLTAYNHRDWDAYASTLSPDLETADHLLVAGKAMRGPAELVEYVRAFVELIPDLRSDVVKPILVEDAGGVALIREHGTDAVGGGAVDIGYVSVGLVGTDDRFRWFEVFPTEQVDVAIARYRDLSAAGEHTTDGY